MAGRDEEPDPLYVVHDGDRIVVALDMPGIEGIAEESANGAIELAELRHGTISPRPPGLRAATGWYATGAVGGLSAGIAGTEAYGLGLGVPVVLATVVAVVLGYRRRRRALADAWRQRHRVLRRTEDTQAFSTARRACDEIIEAWPRFAGMVGVDDPGPVLARSLWTLSEVLENRAALRDQRDELARVRTDLPADTEVRREVDDRVAQLDAALAGYDARVDARLATLAELSERCRRYVREERAIARAREAVLRADRALGDTLPPVDGGPEPGRELADRTAAVLAAYQELSRDVPVS